MNEAAARMAPVSGAVVEAPDTELLVACIATRARRRLAWLDTLAGDTQGDTAERELRWHSAGEPGLRLSAAVEAADAALARCRGGAFESLCHAFALTQVEREIFMSALAVRLDARLLPICQQLQGRPWITEPLVARLFGHGRRPLWNCNGALAAWALVQARESAPAEPPPLVVDEAVPFWLQREGHLDEALAGRVRPIQAPRPLDDWPVAATAAAIREHWEQRRPVRLLVEGGPGTGRASFAAAVAGALDLAALEVDGQPAELPWPRLWMLLQRQAIASGAIPVWREAGAAWPRHLPPARLQALCVEPDAQTASEPSAADLRVRLPDLGRTTRAALRTRLVPASAAWTDAQRARLDDRPGVVLGDLAQLARQGIATLHDAEAQLRQACAGRLGERAERLETGFDWDDLVLPAPLAGALRDFAYEAAHRAAFWERTEVRRLFPGGRALVALFAGPPGTGKTMAAQVIARELGVDLFRIDLATLMSKYIGETAKNLRQVFTRASQMHAVLLFDEADALFANRTEVRDAHDRYANTDTNYLLQLIESFAGIAILASNRKTNIDSAFLRRVRYVFDFPRPDAATRGELWRRLGGALLGPSAVAAMDTPFERLGEALELSGAQIKNALVAAYFAARRRGADPAACDLLKGVERELTKEGRALSPREHRRLGGDA